MIIQFFFQIFHQQIWLILTARSSVIKYWLVLISLLMVLILIRIWIVCCPFGLNSICLPALPLILHGNITRSYHLSSALVRTTSNDQSFFQSFFFSFFLAILTQSAPSQCYKQCMWSKSIPRHTNTTIVHDLFKPLWVSLRFNEYPPCYSTIFFCCSSTFLLSDNKRIPALQTKHSNFN